MSQLEVDKIIPQSGTTLTLGDTGDTINFGSGVLPNFENLTVTGDLTVDTNSLKVDSANNRVGIGTSSPTQALDVVGNLTASGTGTFVNESRVQQFASQSDLIIQRAQGSSGSPTAVANGQTLGVLSFKGYTSAGVYRTGSSLTARVTQGVSGDELPTSLYFSTTANGANSPTERMRITDAGNVGIGTSSPDQKLHISNSASGSVSSILTIENPNGGSGTGVELRFVPSSYNNNIGSTARWSAIRAINGGSGNPTELTFLTNSASADPSERMRIDSSGRLIVNDTSAIFSNSKIQAVNSSGPTLGIKQTTGTQSAGGFWNSSTDASVKVISVYKGTSGNEVGTIGVTNNDNLYIQGDATDSGLQCGTNTILPVQNGVNADNTIDLGASTIRWKDLYLGGGLYVGGTAAANKLDDYEEGTWTPTCVGSTTAGTVTMSSTYTRGRYTKIGNTVYIHCVVVWSSLTGTGNLEITGIPFTSRNIGSANSVNSSFVNFNGLTVPANQIPFARIPNNSDKITTATIPTGGGGTSLLAVDTAGELYFNITYTTDA